MERVELGSGIPQHPQSHAHSSADGSGVLAAYARLAAANVFTLTPQTLNVQNAGDKGLVILGAASQTGRLVELQYSDGTAAFQMGGSGADILATQYASDPIFAGRQAAGTTALPAATPADTIMLEVGGRGYGTSFAASSRAAWRFTTAELHSATAQGSYIDAVLVKKGTTTRVFPFRFTDDSAFRMQEVAAPAAPASGYGNVYASSADSLAHYIDDSGRDNPLRSYGMTDPGSMTIPTGGYLLAVNSIQLSGTEALVLQGTSFARIADL